MPRKIIPLLLLLLAMSPQSVKGIPKSHRHQHHHQSSSTLQLVSLDNPSEPHPAADTPLLPLCCNIIDEEASVSYHCPNTLGTVSSQESGFKRKSWVVPKHLVSTGRATKFSFLTAPHLPCKHATLTVTLPLTPSSKQVEKQRPSYFSTDGYVKYDNQYYNEFCVSGLNPSHVQLHLCAVNCSDPTTPCIQKCCGLNQIYSFGYGENPRGCVDSNERNAWTPTLYHDLETKLSPSEMSKLTPHIIQKFPTSFKFNCRFNKTTVFPFGRGVAEFLSAITHKTFRNLPFRVRSDGYLLYPGDQDDTAKEPIETAKRIENYCIDGTQDYGESGEFSNLEDETILFLCSGGVEEAFETSPSSSSRLQPSESQNVVTASGGQFLREVAISTTPKPPNHLQNFKDITTLVEEPSSSSSLEIEIEDGVPVNSLENTKPSLLPALLKITVQMSNKTPQNTQLSTTGTLPTCCKFTPNVNDGLTHHCRNHKQQGNTGQNVEWVAPEYFMTRGGGSRAFRLTPHPPLTCGPGKFQFQGFIHNFEQIRAKSPGEKKHGLLNDGSLKYDNEFYSPQQYCVNGISSRVLEVLICKPDCSSWETPCLKKCCGMDEIYNLGLDSKGTRGCQPLSPNDDRFSPTLYTSMNTPVSKEEMTKIHPHFIQKYPPDFQASCFNKITLAFPYSRGVAGKLATSATFKHLLFHFRKDGKLMYSYPDEQDGTAVYDNGEYCVDAVRESPSEHFRNNENQTILFICASGPHSTDK